MNQRPPLTNHPKIQQIVALTMCGDHAAAVPLIKSLDMDVLVDLEGAVDQLFVTVTGIREERSMNGEEV